MAKQAELDLLKRGIREWNQWRLTNSSLRPDLSHADLRVARLNGAYLYNVNLRGVRFWGSHLSHADLRAACLWEADLYRADLTEACLRGADLRQANLTEACLRGADLRQANLQDADLQDANLTEANLKGANLSGTCLSGTVLAGIDLREVSGLETVHHRGPSSLSIETIYRSFDQIPEEFLRGAGVPDTFIEYLHSIVVSPMDYTRCVISYVSNDEAFAFHLAADLREVHMCCWLAPEQMKMGDQPGHRPHTSIRFADKLLLVLSAHSIASPWIHDEVEATLEQEQQRGRHILLPLALDETVHHTTIAWVAALRSGKPLANFTRWNHDVDYQQAFTRLLQNLYKET